MAVFFWYHVNVTCPVLATVHAYTGQVTIYNIPETHGHVLMVILYADTFIYKATPIE